MAARWFRHTLGEAFVVAGLRGILLEQLGAVFVAIVRTALAKELHRDFDPALTETRLPERPDYEAAERFLVKAR